MSTRSLYLSGRLFAILLGGLAVTVIAPKAAAGQQLRLLISVNPQPSRVLIEARGEPATSWSFRDSYAGVVGLGKRIVQFTALDESGAELPTRKLAPGHFDSAKAATRFRYEVDLTPPLSSSDAARVSWLNSTRGLLMLADLLPVFSSNQAGDPGAFVRFKLPDSWTVINKSGLTEAGITVPESDEAVFAVGSHLRQSPVSGFGEMDLILDGEWSFADSDVSALAGQVLKAHREVLGVAPPKQGSLILFPFPGPAAATQWSAETRGSTVTLLMGKLPSKSGALAQLSTPLTHELFHLWVPNALSFSGDYDWFYEGFTVYHAARTAVRLELLTFPEFLNAIARAADAASSETNSVSLIEASRKRWTTGQSSVYSKSMLVAFLYDLSVRSRSHGKRSLDDVYHVIFQRYANGARGEIDGNEAATQALAFDPASEKFVRQFIRNPVTIDLANELAPFGFRVDTVSLRTRITVNDNMSKQQRDLLRKLGYNDTVRVPRR